MLHPPRRTTCHATLQSPPKPIHEKLRKALTDTLQSPDFRKKMEATGSVVASPATDTDKYIASEIAKYQKIVQFAKIEE